MKNKTIVVPRRTLFSLLGVLLLIVAGCKALKVEYATVTSDADWLTEGDSAERRHASAALLTPPLEEIWMYNAGAGFGAGSPLLLGNAVIVSTRKGEVHAIDFERGRRLGIEGFGDVVEGTPVIQNGIMYVPVGWGRRALYAFDLTRGSTKWRLKGAPITTGLLALDDGFIAVDAEAWVRKYNAEDGSVLWEQELGDQVTVHATPVLAGRHVVVADDLGQLVALDPADGSIRWTRALHAPVYASIAADVSTLYVPSTRGRFFALDVDRGAVRWTTALPDTTVRYAAPAVDGSLVVVGASDGVLRALDTDTGEEVWAFHNDAALRAAPLLTPKIVYVGSMGRYLFALDRESGELVWEQELKGRVKSALAARDGYLVVLAEPRFVYLFKSSSTSDDVASS